MNKDVEKAMKVYSAAPLQTKLLISCSLFAFSVIGLYVADRLQETYPAPNRQKEDEIWYKQNESKIIKELEINQK
jgi:hypothetical protein